MIPIKLYLLFIFWFLGFIFLWKIPALKKGSTLNHLSYKISILIPARNEERTLGHLLHSIAHQTLKPHEIIVIDDQSEDATAEVARRAGCIVMTSKGLPEGWTGKPWACWQGAQKATGDAFLFLDADTSLEPEGLSKIVSTYLEKGGLLSIQPFHKMKRTYERLAAIFNLITMAGMNAFTPFGPKLKPTGAFGPCMMCSREDYFRVGGHEKARGEVLESLAIGREFLRGKRKVHCYGGKEAISFRMYPDGFQSLVEGFGKGFGTGAYAMSIMSLFVIGGWVFGGISVTRHLLQSAILGNAELLGWLALDVLYIFQIHWMLFRIGNFGFSTALFFQIPLVFFVIVFAYSVVRIFLVRKVRWKGRDVKTASGRN
ncbi:MAG TPA: glycosyltransferase family A protein [Thermodesulfobacteriota bacterium]|nr:glycosyltransferase family A protein [Thermodesulfobacteriota bacterium]